MSYPQPPAGTPGQPDHAPTAPLPPQGAPTPPKTPAERPGRMMAILALVFAIVGTLLVCLGFAVFIPEIGRVLGYVSFSGWLFLLAGLTLSIVALVRKAQATGMSIAALIISIVGGVFGIVAGVVVAIAGVMNFTMTMVDDYGDLIPERPDSGFTAPESSHGAAVRADCETLISSDPGSMGGSGSVADLLDRLAEQMTTDEVREPLEDLSDAYEDLTEIDDPSDVQEAAAELDRAAAELGEVCGISLDDLP
ncbi:hypothetical protein [Microbacterium suaedae]|uniref:hypothetical protein n=1 Tax=Microbacterium suaedae TaxID=2067813 RepID=UPI0013A66FF8|nr:hypothetical protein [Microbacterium suaedae]